jgi:DNA-binding NarL/FixJ family response regulator
VPLLNRDTEFRYAGLRDTGGVSAVTPGAAFVGRGRELDVLAAHLAAHDQPAGGVLLVSGPAGVGKTRLVDEAVRRAAGSVVIRGYCPAETAPPLWPWRAALKRAGVEIAREPDIEPAAAKSAKFAALAQMSDALIALGPVAVVLEDLHWADAASLDLLAQVGAVAGGTGLTIIGTLRFPSARSVAVRLADLGRYGAVTLALAPFTPDEVAELVDPAVAPEVHKRTGGLPLLVAAVRDGYESADLAVVVRSLLAGLTPAQRVIIEVAAVLGESVDEHILAAAVAERGDTPADPADPADPAGWHDEGIADALAAAWRGGLLAVDAATRCYRFAHALVRDGILDGLDPVTARALHRAAALALQTSADADRAGRLALHWRRAGTDSETRRAAAQWARRAAANARAARAYDDSVRLLGEALADMSALAGDSVDRAEVLIELAHAEYLAGRYDRCLERCGDAADVAAAAGRGDLVARSALVMQNVTFPQAAAVLSRLCQRALAYPRLELDLHARVLAQLATATADSGQVARAEVLAREALALAAQSGDPLAEIEAAHAREMTLVHAGDTAERMRLGDLVADRAEALGLPLAALMGHEWRLHAAYLSAQFDVVDTAVAAIERLTRTSALPLARWHLHRLYAARTLLTGQFADSADHSGRAFAIARDSGDAIAMSMHFAHGIRLALVREDAGCLPGGYREALAAAPSMPIIDVERANVLVLTGSVREARDMYDRLCDLLPLPAEHPAWMAVLTQMVGLIQRFDDAAAAEVVYQQLLPFRPYPGALGTSTVYFIGTISRSLGELATVFGDKATAIELLREALPRNRAIGARPDTAATLLDLARLLRSGNRAEMTQAAALAQDALDLAARLDMPGTVAAAGRLAAQIAADCDQADPLTSREREVAALLAEALSNRQIAVRLVLSERTVESHVRSILAKTQCANRIEFVARWNQSGAGLFRLDPADQILPADRVRQSRMVGGHVPPGSQPPDDIAGNLNPVGRVYYNASTQLCLPNALSQPGGYALARKPARLPSGRSPPTPGSPGSGTPPRPPSTSSTRCARRRAVPRGRPGYCPAPGRPDAAVRTA